MALEDLVGADKFIDDLVDTNPVEGDDVAEGNEHIQGIKNVLGNSFPAITGAVTSTHTELNILDGVTATTAELNLLDGVTATTEELNYVDGVTSNIQTQIDGVDNNSSFTGSNRCVKSIVALAADGVASNTEITVGATGSGQDYEWPALDSVPATADWIEVLITGNLAAFGIATNTQVICQLFASGVSGVGNLYDLIFAIAGYTDTSGDTTAAGSSTAKIPWNGTRFYLKLLTANTTTDDVDMYLVGYGKNGTF
jgi:hypothetical protein